MNIYWKRKRHLKNYLEKGHLIYIYNFYTSGTYVKNFFRKKNYITETLRQRRRGNLPEVSSKNRGETITKHPSGVAVEKWRGKRDVLFIFTE